MPALTVGSTGSPPQRVNLTHVAVNLINLKAVGDLVPREAFHTQMHRLTDEVKVARPRLYGMTQLAFWHETLRAL